jgi:hypothetical protein
MDEGKRTSGATRIVVTVLTVLCVFHQFAGNAWCEILVAKTRTSPWIFGGASYHVGFANSADETFSFSTSEPNTRVVIFFNAECAVQGNAYNYIDIDLLVDPAGATDEVAASPSNGDNAFCSGNSEGTDFISTAGDGWISATTQATIVLPVAGVHTVKVRVNGNGTVSRLDDLSLIVMR